ncbi:MAG: putative metalloprotease CJM1_0395 family protein [Opitutales bacterium]
MNILPSMPGMSHAGPSPMTTRVRIVPAEENSAPGKQLDAEERAALRKLQARDAEVRAHEAAHLGAAGGLAVSGASYTYATGPDGQQYAVGGEVSIDTSKEPTPEETVEKARQIQAAALAPANPSATDLRVAAKAALMGLQAAAEATEADGAAPATDDPEASPAGEERSAEFSDAAVELFDFDQGKGSDPAPEMPGAPPEEGRAAPMSALAERVFERYFAGIEEPGSFLAYA